MDTTIRDSDLLEKLHSAHGKAGFETLRGMLEAEQAQRDAERALSPIKRRRVQTRKQIQTTAFENDDRHHIHSVLALCGLPYRNVGQDVREIVREYGRNSLTVQAGFLKDPMSGKMVPQGIPYGPKARLLLLHICTMAIRQKNPQIEIADSMSAFIRDLGFAVTGGKKGTITQFKEQLNRLAASRMQIGLWRGERATTVNAQPIKSLDIWLPTNPDQKLLWSSTLRLDQDFYDSLQEHALPVDMRMLRAFSQSARQLDLVLWLGYRLRNLDRRYPLSWDRLREQFGSETSSPRRFKQQLAADLEAVRDVFPNLAVDVTTDGIVLKPTDAEQLFVAKKRTLIAPYSKK